MTRALALLAVLLLFAGCTSDAQVPKAGGVVVLELFTSQGCSSCPPADRLLSKLRREDLGGTVIPLAYHVDYWNYIGWTDPFSSPRWSNRQREYARKLKSGVYTPQLVVNGRAQLVGSSERHVRAEIERQLRRPPNATVTIDRIERANGVLTVHVRASRKTVVVTLFQNGITTDVSRGENVDQRLVNDAIVRWQGVAEGPTVTIPLAKEWRDLGVAAFVQDPVTLEIHAAAVREVG